MTETLLIKLVFWAGIGHFILCVASLSVPKALQWREQLKPLQPLLRQMFWTYAGYILVINCWFGVISVWGTDELLSHTMLAKSLTLFIALYWFARIGIQFLYFDRTQVPKGRVYTLGEIALVSMLSGFAVIYLLAFIHNIT